MQVFSARLKWLRERKRLSQQAMADLLGITQSYYGKFELDKGEPNLETLKKLPEILGESVDFMLGVADYTENCKAILQEFDRCHVNVASIINDIEELSINPQSKTLLTSKDFDPDDPQSVTVKLQRLEKQLPLWKDRLEIARDKLKRMLDEIPMVGQETYDYLLDENNWVGLLDRKNNKDSQ